MRIEESLEQLAFGRVVPKIGSCIGLSLSEEAAFAAEVHVKGGRPVVDHLVRVPLPGAAGAKDTQTRVGGTLNTEILSDTGRLSALLKPAMTHVKWASQYMVLSLSQHFGLLRYFVMPAVDRRFWKTAIPAEARKHIPLQFEELVYDYQVFPINVVPGPNKRLSQGVLFGVTHRRNVSGAAALAEKLGFKLLGIDLAPCSVERLWGMLANQHPVPPRTCLHLDGGLARVLVSDAGVPVFFRTMLLAEAGTKPDLRKVDLAGCMDFCRKQFNAAVSRDIQLSGADAQQQAAWTQALVRDLEMPVRVQDASKVLDLKTREWGSYAAIGGALHHLAPPFLKIDLGPSFRVANEEKRAAYTLFALAGALIVLLLTMSVWRLGMSFVEAHKLSRLQRQRESVPVFQNMTKDQIVNHMQEMEKKSQAFGGLLQLPMKSKQVLECLADDIPEAVWLSAVTYSDPLGKTAAAGNRIQTLHLSGYVLGPSAMDDQEIAFQFKNRLQADEAFSKVFECSSPDVQANLSAGAKAGGPRNEDQRTAFTIECKAKQQNP